MSEAFIREVILKGFTAVVCLLRKAELVNINMMILNMQRRICMG